LTERRPKDSNTKGCSNKTDDNDTDDDTSGDADDDTDNDMIVPIHNGLMIILDSAAFRATCVIQQSSRFNKPLLNIITVDFSRGKVTYSGRVLFKFWNSRFLYAVALAKTGTEKAFILHSKDFPDEAKQLDNYDATTARDLEHIKRLDMNTVAMIRLGDQIYAWSECAADRNMLLISNSVLTTGWSKQLTRKNIAEKRKLQGQKNLLKTKK